jgi:hypothetical protein
MENATSMDDGVDTVRHDELERLETYLQSQFGGRVRNFRLMHSGDGIVLLGITRTYYAKQMAQHAVMQATPLPIASNQIEVI